MSQHTPALPTVLVLCTGNSCRSQMAEALLAQTYPGRLHVISAGTHPQPAVAPEALLALQAIGIPTAGLHPKDLTSIAAERVDLVVTVCDNARESCPVFPGEVARLHMAFPDPHGHPLEVFVAVRDDIRTRLLPAVGRALSLED